MPSRKIEHLAASLRPLHTEWAGACERQGIEVLTTCTYRSKQEQKDLYAIGRTKPGSKVTWTLDSRHCEVDDAGQPGSTAWDFVILVGGKPCWDASHPHWEKAGATAESLGLEWGGRWKKGRDLPHIQSKRG